MMLSVLVWLAMQLPYNSVDCDPQMRNGKEYQQCAVDAPVYQTPELCQEYGDGHGIVLWSNCSPKPAEHVTTEPVDPPYAWSTQGQDCQFIDEGSVVVKKCGTIVDVITRPKPAEHVIEIKTRRVLPKGEDHCYVATTVPNSANDGKTQPCPPDVRELWIDGVRWGVVKGLD